MEGINLLIEECHYEDQAIRISQSDWLIARDKLKQGEQQDK